MTCLHCLNYSSDPETGTCPLCNPKCPNCDRHFNTLRGRFACPWCEHRPTFWAHIMDELPLSKAAEKIRLAAGIEATAFPFGTIMGGTRRFECSIPFHIVSTEGRYLVKIFLAPHGTATPEYYDTIDEAVDYVIHRYLTASRPKAVSFDPTPP